MADIQFTVNEKKYKISVSADTSLLDVLREELGLTGTKRGCEIGECGACTVIMDGKTVNSCLIFAVQVDGAEITTIEGIADGDKLHPVQESFLKHDAVQCGFCTPGMVLSAVNLLNHNPEPDENEIKQAIAGNICRCTGYQQIVTAIKDVKKQT